ncbi:hypothetical protein PsorP6_017993 [Peronosclerospora sorghi]|uniref:Uncharacterized protein n=1 Tax=Peronosclerospora sorghi TaxID=230839 RepID=A0ACC0WE20_9STRA|nr:hypothetical protein PsorP6_017993 [Peronosclerospora sorghi]
MPPSSSALPPPPLDGDMLSEEMEEELSTLPNMELSHLYFVLQHAFATHGTIDEHCAAKKQVLELIERHAMTPFYRRVCREFHWPVDPALEARMEAQNALELARLDARVADAEQNLGEIEVLEAMLAKARMYSRIGEKDKALEAFALASDKPQSSNQQILVALHIIRIGLFFNDLDLVEQYIAKATAYVRAATGVVSMGGLLLVLWLMLFDGYANYVTRYIDEGGDWDRRNRLKVYEGCYLLLTRDFKKAATRFQESIATFTATELMPYRTLVFYSVVTCVLSLPRVELKEKIVDSPEILAVMDEIPFLRDFLNGIYECKYQTFFTALVQLEPMILQDKYLSTHARYLYRELRVLAYAQFLEAYRSVTLDSMATAFGVSMAFLDKELARFIAAGRLNAKIDKVDGVIETNRPDMKNAQYQDAIKKGDLLLNRIQKLARVINV